MTSKTFYATCDCNGPISARIEAQSVDDALKQIDRHGREWIDEPRLDAEDDLSEVSWEGWTEEQVTAEMQRLGWRYIYQTDIAGDWCLWETSDDE